MSKGERLPRRSAEVVYVWRSMCVRREALTFECRAAVANFSSSGSSRTLDGVGRQRVCGLGSRLLIGEQRGVDAVGQAAAQQPQRFGAGLGLAKQTVHIGLPW